MTAQKSGSACYKCAHAVFSLLESLLKNAHLLRCAYYSSLRRTKKYASFLMISCALHLRIFEQPVKKKFLNNLLIVCYICAK